jgi:hypothetical protein
MVPLYEHKPSGDQPTIIDTTIVQSKKKKDGRKWQNHGCINFSYLRKKQRPTNQLVSDGAPGQRRTRPPHAKVALLVALWGQPGNASVEAVWVQPGGADVEAVGSQPGARWRQDSRRDRGSPGRVGVEVVGGSSGRTNVQAVVGSPGRAGVEAIGGSSGRAGVEGSAKFHTRRCLWERGGGTPGFPLVDQVSRSPNTTSHSQHL